MTCKDCEKRRIGCHDECEDYQKERAERAKRRERERQEYIWRGYMFERNNRVLFHDDGKSKVFRSRKK